MHLYKIERIWVNELPIEDWIKESDILTNDDCYIGYSLFGDVSIWQKENEKFIRKVTVDNPEIFKLMFILEHIEKIDI